MYDIIVIGAGPAGASAAIYTAKAGKKTLVLENDQSVTKPAWIRNHYGAPDIDGPELLKVGQEQAKSFGAEIVSEEVTEVSNEGNGQVKVKTENNEYEAKYVILATGNSAKLAEASGITTKEGTEPRIKTIVDADNDGRTSMENVWAAGVTAGVSVHTIITAGDGANVAINILSEMNGERYADHDMLKDKE
ncbi:NAD(P)/FAD-dependent oxidoreductase [Alteribacillus iranensis]|uniref:Pyridine nucleotide-disulphide oxidoreductase n=1 Tax=Alteribacillus iranensis TaxID=930128 RepID=A0A1I2B1H5_9BACI|nr:FAD-dependent oxidoreductase [Alteribacillus iranensis]SFE50032.1 Pyridine nucleotide-disulphide oxidoreductase [Alteribacillus iranensis]